MKAQFKINLAAVCVLAATSFGATQVNAADEGFKNTIDVRFRYRMESVDQEGFSEDALASILRTRATIKTRWSDKFDSVVQLDDLTNVGADSYNAAAGNTPDKSQYPVIADQEGTEVNEAYIRYNGDATKVAYGRQRINILNERFIGGVGWRQNEQTYDGLTVKTKLNDKFDFNYAYIFNVNRIFGENVPAGDHQQSTNLLDANYKLDTGLLSAYYFSIDNKTLATFSNDTFGVRYKGKYDALSLTLEFATQSAGDNNPNDYDADYSLLHASYQLGDFSVGGGIETLGGDTAGGQGFTTSLATLHGFQGWADVFLGTPVAGIEDSSLEATYKFSGYKFKVVYHDFATDEGGVDLGTEIDWALSKKVNKNLSALLKYADFNSDSASYASRRKVWLMLSYNLK